MSSQNLLIARIFPAMNNNVLYATLSVCVVVFSGLMSGLTLGLMSLDMMDLQVLERSGTEAERKYVKKIMPVVTSPHFTLVTLLFLNAIALEALPILLNQMMHEATAIALSVTVVLFFGEIIPQAVCCRYGLVIGAHSAPFVLFLRRLTSPITWPISKCLDYLIGENHTVIFKRGHLKAVVALSSTLESKEGELTEDEVQVINGALDMQAKPVEQAMTPLDKVYMVSADTVVDRDSVTEIVQTGHSRIPVYSAEDKNDIIGLVLVKELLTVDQEAGKTMKELDLRNVVCLPSNLPMYDVLHLFKSGRSHMAVLKKALPHSSSDPSYDYSTWADLTRMTSGPTIGIITLEDLIEELIQTEIVDETDRYTDNTQEERVTVHFMESNLPPRVKKWIQFTAPGVRRLGASRSRDRNGNARRAADQARRYSIPLLSKKSEHM